MQLSSPGSFNLRVAGATAGRAKASTGATRLQQNKLAPAAKDSVHFGSGKYEDDEVFQNLLSRIQNCSDVARAARAARTTADMVAASGIKDTAAETRARKLEAEAQKAIDDEAAEAAERRRAAEAAKAKKK